MFTDRDEAILYGQKTSIYSPPFVQDGFTYVSVNEASSLLNIEFELDSETNIITLSHNGYSSQFMIGFNLIVKNANILVIMRSITLEKDGTVYLPTTLLAEIVDVPFFQDCEQGVIVFNSRATFTREAIHGLKIYMNLEIANPKSNKNIDNLEQVSRSERLFVSDENGVLYKWILLDDFTLIKEEQTVNFSFDKNTAYIVGDTNLDSSDNDYLFKSHNFTVKPE